MGAGGSVSMPKEMPSDAQIQEAAKAMPPEAIDIMKKIIAAAEKSSEKSPAEKPAEAGKLTRPAIKKIGNSDAEGVDMERAIFMWDEEKSKECLKEILEGEMPEVVNGAMLVMEEVVWPDPRDAKNWPEFLRQVAGKFLDDQVNADEPFVPPENAREHCLYLMNPTQADAYLEKLGLKKVGKTGKQLMQDDERNEALGMDDGDKVYESFPDTAVLFIKDLVKKRHEPMFPLARKS